MQGKNDVKNIVLTQMNNANKKIRNGGKLKAQNLSDGSKPYPDRSEE